MQQFMQGGGGMGGGFPFPGAAGFGAPAAAPQAAPAAAPAAPALSQADLKQKYASEIQ